MTKSTLVVKVIIAFTFLATCVHSHGFHRHDSQKFFTLPSNLSMIQNGVLNLEIMNHNLAKCEVVKELNALLTDNEKHMASITQEVFSFLFPFGAGLNSVLATFYISVPPILLISLMPINADAVSHNALVAFAVGCLLGDIFLHLLPRIFIGESIGDSVRFVIVDDRRNTLLGGAIFCGFMAFIILDKFVRIFMGSHHSHSHSYSHTHDHSYTETGEQLSEDGYQSKSIDSEISSVLKGSQTELKRRRRGSSKHLEANQTVPVEKLPAQTSDPSSSAKLSAYFNLAADFFHNLTDGLALTASFYVSPSVGAASFIAMFFHEVPHQLSDFAVLIQGGFSRSQAMKAQFATVLGTFIGTIVGILLNNISALSTSTNYGSIEAGLFGTSIQIGDMLLPFTTGGFLYIVMIGVIPDILNSGEGLEKVAQIKQAIIQLVSCLAGVMVMVQLSRYSKHWCCEFSDLK